MHLRFFQDFNHYLLDLFFPLLLPFPVLSQMSRCQL